MAKDRLFLLPARFIDPKRGDNPYFCPSCATLEGVLSHHPEVRNALEIHYVPFPRPRDEIAALLGAAHQSAPVLVFSEENARRHSVLGQASPETGRRFLSGFEAIADYLTEAYGASRRH